MKSLLRPERISGESKIVSFRVPAQIHQKLHKVTDLAKAMGMRLAWQDLLREHLDEYVKLADNELKKYEHINPQKVGTAIQSVSP